MNGDDNDLIRFDWILEKFPRLDNMDSMRGVLEYAVDKALYDGRKEGIEEGRKEGIEEGRKEGIEEGRKEGIEEGRKEGIEEGREEGRKELIRKMLANGMRHEDISRITGIDTESLNAIIS